MSDCPPSPFECPRCHQSVHETYYGPCATCLSDLRARFAAVERDLGDTRFEPAMHVTPNAVATKE